MTDRFRRYREELPVHWHAPSQAWLITRHADVDRLLTDPRLTSATLEPPPGFAGFFGGWLSLTDGEKHQELRRLVAPLLSPARVAPWAPVLHDIAEDQRRETDFARPYAKRVIQTVLGLTPDELDDVLPATGRLLQLLTPGNGQPHQAREALRVVRETEQRLTERQGLLRGLEIPGEMSGAILVQFVAGGYEPLVRCLTAAKPGDDVEELLRLHAPFELLPRTTTEPVEVGDQHLPPGARVLLAIGSANHDEQRTSSLTFGGGRHRCPAAHLGRLAVAAALNALNRPANAMPVP